MSEDTTTMPQAEEEHKTLTGSFGQISMLKKGEEVSLESIDPALKEVLVGVGWDAPEEVEGKPIDIDVSAFLLNRDGRVRNDLDFVFYNNLTSGDGSVRHQGDNTTGDGDGDDETIHIDLTQMSYDVERIAFAVTLHNAEERGQSFGLVKNAFIRIVNKETNTELAHFDLTEDAAGDTGIVFGELVRHGMNWNFRAIGRSTKGGLYNIAHDYAVNVAPV